MTQVINWCTAHLQELLAIIGGLVGVATVVVKLTPTQKDDAFLGKVIKVLSALSLVNPDGSFVGSKK